MKVPSDELKTDIEKFLTKVQPKDSRNPLNTGAFAKGKWDEVAEFLDYLMEFGTAVLGLSGEQADEAREHHDRLVHGYAKRARKP